MKRIRTAVIGTGFMGRVHLEALRRIGPVEVVAVAGRELAAAQRLGERFGVPRAESDYTRLLLEPEIDAVHVCTPNVLHFSMAKAALLAGKHVLCEKPLALSVEEGRQLEALAGERGLRNCVCHNLRFYPMVQQMRRMRESGELGEVLVVQGTYSQDWLLYDTDWNWRVDPQASGASRAMADIGSHWFDAAEHISGLDVSALCADLSTFHANRKRPLRAAETFGDRSADGDAESVPVTTEDFGAVIFRMDGGARGAMTASQVSAGRKNHLSIEVYGTKSGVAWNQERPNELWVGRRNEANRIMIKDPALLLPDARGYADVPGGHAEGYPDTFKQLFRRFYRSIDELEAAPDYPQFADGLRGMRILEATLRSNRTRAWTEIGG